MYHSNSDWARGKGSNCYLGNARLILDFITKGASIKKILTKYKNIHLEDSPTQRLELICVAAPSCRLPRGLPLRLPLWKFHSPNSPDTWKEIGSDGETSRLVAAYCVEIGIPSYLHIMENFESWPKLIIQWFFIWSITSTGKWSGHLSQLCLVSNQFYFFASEGLSLSLGSARFRKLWLKFLYLKIFVLGFPEK